MRLINSAEIAIVSGGTSNWVQVDGQGDCVNWGDDSDVIGMGFASKQGNSSGSGTDKSGQVTCPSGTVPSVTVKTKTETKQGGGGGYFNLPGSQGGANGGGETTTTTTESTTTCVKPK